MQTLSEIRLILAQHGLRPKHRLGQNFLHDQNQLRRLVAAAGIQPGDVVLEIGPGTGTLTEALVEVGASVIVCELDEGLAKIVEERVHVPVIHGDALARHRELNPQIVRCIAGRDFKLVANLPYQAASPLITALLLDFPNCTGQFITIQKEVADRLVAAPSTKAFGPLSVIVQSLATVSRISTLSPSCFWPEPEVTSSMVAIIPNSSGRSAVKGGEREFARFVTELFMKRRKQLGTIIGRKHPAWPALVLAGIHSELRPEALRVTQIIHLWRMVKRQP